MSEQITAPISQDQYNRLSEQILNIQKTVDRMYEDHGEWQDENNNKLNDIKERVGKLEQVHNDIVETFKDIGFKFKNQTKEIVAKVENSIYEETKPISTKIDNLVDSKSKVLHYITKPQKKWWQFWKNGKNGKKGGTNE